MAESGRRNRRVAIYSVSDGAGGSGFPIETTTLLGTVWASHEGVTGSERFANDQLSAPFDSKFDVPYAAQWDPELMDIAKERRLVYENRSYDIVHGRRTGLKRDDVTLWALARQG